MSDGSYTTGIDEELADNLVRVARTSLGDTLRSVLYFTPSQFDVLYVRSDLYDSAAAARGAKSRLVDFEAAGFAEAPVRTAISGTEGAREGSDIGPYEFTVRFHRNGFVVRILEGDAGVILTTDGMNVTAFEDAAGSIRTLLADR
jgi:hypothetical protein